MNDRGPPGKDEKDHDDGGGAPKEKDSRVVPSGVADEVVKGDEEQPSSMTTVSYGGAEQGGNFGCQDIRFDTSYEPPSRPGQKKNDGGKGKKGGKSKDGKKGGDGKNGGGTDAGGGGGAGAGGGGGRDKRRGGVENEPPALPPQEAGKPPNLSIRMRKHLETYERTLDMQEIQKAIEGMEASHAAGEGCCDAHTLQMLLVALTRAGKLVHANKVVDIAVENKVYIDANCIVIIALAVSQRSQSHKALRYLRSLIHGALNPELNPPDKIAFLDRHASFIFSEFMAEADGCFGRMENRDFGTLVNLGHAEPDIVMDWEKSSATQFMLWNRQDDKGRKIYVPTVQNGGFQRSDTALMSFDISFPEIAAKVPRSYDKIHDGAEIEITVSASAPGTSAPLTVKLTSPPKVPFEEGMSYRMDRLASRDQTRRMLEALKVVLKESDEKGGRTDGMSSLQPSAKLRELILVPSDTTLAKAGKEELPLEAMDHGASVVRQQNIQNFMEESKERHGASLNASQLEALTQACTRRVTLIQGPPGTGKTTTAVQIVTALVEYRLVDAPMLVTADSNTAVDNLVKGVGKKGLGVVRVGRPESIREDVKQYALDGRWKELKKADVVCATCIGASGSTLDKARFGTVLIDECTQAAESAALVPIARGCQQVILIGDQCQLPPTVLSDVAENENLGESLFTRLVTQGVRPVLLDTQYRMHPLIAEFASAAFYNGRLQNGVSHISRKPPDGFPWPQRQMPVAFVNLERGEEKREGSSYVNPAEAEKILWALQEVCKTDLGPEEVGIVTPYKGQVNLIKKLIRERLSLSKFRTGLEVESVDGFQGQEKEVIIFCAVRNNREGKVGFLSDWRRLNVMLTRARRGCIVIGSRTTLMQDPLWQEWLKWATARGAICGESAKGTWVPRYLVDDRDGVWQVKASIVEEAGKGGAAGLGSAAAKPAAPVVEEVLDNWEDAMSDSDEEAAAVDPPAAAGDSPAEVPAAEPAEVPAASEPAEVPAASQAAAPAVPVDAVTEAPGGDPKNDPDQPSPSAGVPAPELSTADAVADAQPTVRSRIGSSVVDDDEEDEPRRCGTPCVGPKSPSRQIALAKIGLLDDLDLDDQ